MENSFLKNENTLLKENIEELKNVIQKYQENEQVNILIEFKKRKKNNQFIIIIFFFLFKKKIV